MVTATASRNGKSTATSVETHPDETVGIKPLNIRRVVVTVRGTQPLITNKFSDEAERKLEASQSGAERIKQPKAPRLPEQEFLGARYLIEDHGDPAKDVCGFPAAGIKKAMVNAGGRVSDAKMTWLRATFNIEAEVNGLVRIVSGPPSMRTDHVVQMGRGNLRYRPHFWPWTMQVPIVFNADHLSAGDVVNLLQQAGFSIGIGDWRPEKNGTFGTFEVVSE